MKEKVIIFIKNHMLGSIAVASVSIILFLIITISLFQSNLDGEIAILEAGVEDIPVIKNDDLQELGKLYSKLNDQFEREIDALVTGPTNRHNKSDNRINPLTHYGVYGQDNPNPFKNNDYVNGAIIKYEKATASIADGASNFNDIISVMAILYDQKMDTIETDELKQIFTDMFWLSHTYTYDSSELYPCKSGCSAVNSYRCKDVYNDYSNTNLKYDPFTVRRHSNYEDKGYDYDEDFRIVLPEGQCEICGKQGTGCIWEENRVCYHGGSANTTVASCEEDVNTIEDIVYSSVGETYKAEGLEDEFISNDETKGTKIDKKNNTCRYYKDIKFCNTKKSLANQIKSAKQNLKRAEERASNHSSSCTYSGDGECGTCKSNDRAVESASQALEALQNQLEAHISTVCEKDEATSKYWCDGFKICLGHKTHYSCPWHKLVCCFGHTNITVTIKVLYRDELLDKAFSTFN